MEKVISLLICVLVFLVISVGCEATEQHQHTFLQTNEANGHRYECECGYVDKVESHNFVWKTDVPAYHTVTGYRHKECSVCGYVTDENSPYEAEKNEDGTLKIDKKLTDALTEYLKASTMSDDFAGATMCQLIDRTILGEKTPLLINLSESNTYYVCAYFASSHKFIEEEYAIYCCRSEYTWIGFEKAEDILESYNGIDFFVAFQINLSDSCINMLSGENAGVMEHFIRFTPEFVGGKNTLGFISFDTSFLFFSNEMVERIFYCSDTYKHEYLHLDLIEIEGEQYISEYQPLYTVDESGKRYDRDLGVYYGRHYDSLLDILIRDKYQKVVESKTGVTLEYYGVFKIRDFIKIFQDYRPIK
jgi:hypothetical protein